jgi:pimeloyl-ACP methyl ester carboxylesterase
VPEPAPRVVVLGWHGSTERQLRVIARWYQARGHAVRVVITPTFRTMGRRGAWPAFGLELAKELGDEPLILHAFSNAGFWTMSALLDALPSKPLRVIVDSAPGFPEKIPMWVTAKFATAAMMPGFLASLGRKPRSFHPVLTPVVAAFFGAWHLVAHEQLRFMETGQRRVIDELGGVPLLAIWSDADTLVPAEHVVRFLDHAARAGVSVTRLHFTDSAHIRHFVQYRAEYFARLAAFLDAS